MKTLFKNERLALIEAAKWGFALLVAFKVPVTEEQKLAILGLLGTVLTIVQRQLVSPAYKLKEQTDAAPKA